MSDEKNLSIHVVIDHWHTYMLQPSKYFIKIISKIICTNCKQRSCNLLALCIYKYDGSTSVSKDNSYNKIWYKSSLKNYVDHGLQAKNLQFWFPFLHILCKSSIKLSYNLRQTTWNKVKKTRKIGQEQKTFFLKRKTWN